MWTISVKLIEGCCECEIIATNPARELSFQGCLCDAKGWDTEWPSAYVKVVETNYKGHTDGQMIADIQDLANESTGEYTEGSDEDGDYFWRVVFRLSDCVITH